MNTIIAIKIRAALQRARENQHQALTAAREIKAQRHAARAALHRARARRLFAAWLDPRNPGWPAPPTEKPANVISITTAPRASDIQFPRIGQTLGGLHFQRKGGAA